MVAEGGTSYNHAVMIASSENIEGVHPRRFDSTVKRLPKLRFEPVSFLFLVCLYIVSSTIIIAITILNDENHFARISVKITSLFHELINSETS